MKLIKEEEEMVEGKYGRVVQKAMELLVAVGECYDAERMVPVASAHLVGANRAAGKGGMRFIKELAEGGGKFLVPLTTNPAALDLWAWKDMGFSEEHYLEQISISDAIAKMGGFVCNTCAPYLIGHAPRMRTHVAYGESSVVLYANAVLGSRTNREGGPSALAAALTGRTPCYGYHLDENRHGALKIHVNAALEGDTDYATLGYFAGGIALDRVPIFTGLPSSLSQDSLKSLGPPLATKGSVAHYHVVGVTPEAPTEEAASGFKKISPSDIFEFGPGDLKATEESLSRAGPEEATLVILGCPHPSIGQIKKYAEVLSGRKVKDHVEIWILIPHGIKQVAEDIGYAPIIESTGARLLSNVCPAAMPLDYYRKRGYKIIATDSPKTVYYTSTTKDALCYYGSLEKFVDVVTRKA